MKQVLYVGQVPETVDFSDPALPPGSDAAKVHAGIEVAMAAMKARGWLAQLCLVRPDSSAGAELAQRLAQTRFDCVVIGAGLRVPPKSLPLFETLLNAVHRGAPGAAIAFNTRPDDTADAVARWIDAA